MSAIRERAAAAWKSARDLWDIALGLDVLEVAALLTVGLLLLHAGSAWYLTIPMTVLCIAGFVVRPLLLSPPYWLLIACINAFANFRNWYSVDNHKFLTTYWCLAIYCALTSREPRAALSVHGRWLVALCFSFADFWKIISRDFLTGGFFTYQLLADHRFSWVARVVAGVPRTGDHLNGVRISNLKAVDAVATSTTLVGGSRLYLTAQFMTWWTIVIEVLIAAAWLCPERFRFSRLRHPLLILFVLTTYAVANVIGFGWLLLVMGLAHTAPEARRTRGLYYACFVFLHVFLVPFRNFGSWS